MYIRYTAVSKATAAAIASTNSIAYIRVVPVPAAYIRVVPVPAAYTAGAATGIGQALDGR